MYHKLCTHLETVFVSRTEDMTEKKSTLLCLCLLFLREARVSWYLYGFKGVGWFLHGTTQQQQRKLMEPSWEYFLRHWAKNNSSPSVKIHEMEFFSPICPPQFIWCPLEKSQEHFPTSAKLARLSDVLISADSTNAYFIYCYTSFLWISKLIVWNFQFLMEPAMNAFGPFWFNEALHHRLGR